MQFSELQRPHDLDLDLGSGHTAYRCISVIDLYLHTKFHWNRQTSCGWMDVSTDRHFKPPLIFRSTLTSRPKMYKTDIGNWQWLCYFKKTGGNWWKFFTSQTHLLSFKQSVKTGGNSKKQANHLLHWFTDWVSPYASPFTMGIHFCMYYVSYCILYLCVGL